MQSDLVVVCLYLSEMEGIELSEEKPKSRIDLQREVEQQTAKCPTCGHEVLSHRNWALRGRGSHVVRVYLFECPNCSEKFRASKKVEA